MSSEILEEALTVRDAQGSDQAVLYLTEQGFPLELAWIAICGLRQSRLLLADDVFRARWIQEPGKKSNGETKCETK